MIGRSGERFSTRFGGSMDHAIVSPRCGGEFTSCLSKLRFRRLEPIYGSAACYAERLRLSVSETTHQPHSRRRRHSLRGGANEEKRLAIGPERRSLSAKLSPKTPPSKPILTSGPRGVLSNSISRRRSLKVSENLQEGEKMSSPVSSESSRILTPSAINPTPPPEKDKYKSVWCAFQLIKGGKRYRPGIGW